MEPTELCSGWRRKIPALAVATLIFLVASSATFLYGYHTAAGILAVPMFFAGISLVLIEILHALPTRAKTELALIFFRVLNHKWDRFQYVREGGEQRCTRCGDWRHCLTVEQYGEAARVEWRRGRYPRVLRAVEIEREVKPPFVLAKILAAAALFCSVVCALMCNWIAAAFAFALACNYASAFSADA